MDDGEITDEDISKLLIEALSIKIPERRKAPSKVELNRALVATLGEFLSCYRLIGYDLSGNPVKMQIYQEKMQKAALDNAFMEEINAFMREDV